ncbi:MAG TPA: glycosyltransferase [Elusimicrobiota bacterium]|nr:glycosyltransferase [Elusimicrobiota bacterium]
MKFSVVVAAHNEGPQIGSALKRLRQISKTSPMELIVVDGGSDDGTVAAASDWADNVLRLDKAGRGAQWDAGAKAATGDLLFFLRADSQPPGNWQQALEHFWLATQVEGVSAVGFSVNYGAGARLRLLSAWSNARVRGGMIGADHGVCTTPEIYKAVGGFPPFPELEDLEFSRRLKARGRVHLLRDVIHSAARRLRSQGPLRYAARRLWLEGRYKLGAKPEDLFRTSLEL